MALVLKDLLVSDTLNQVIDKINFNTSQLKLNGGGSQGIPGKDSVVKGVPGIRGSIWFYGIGDPNTQLFTDLLDNDYYLADDGHVWLCNDSINQTWIDTGLIMKGGQGIPGDDGSGVFSSSDVGFNEHYYYTEPIDLGTGATDIRAFLFGGYPDAGGHTMPASVYENLNASDAIVYLYTPTPGLKQLKFINASTASLLNAPSMYTLTDDVFYIENKRLINPSNATVVDGIILKTTDSSIRLDSFRDISITADGRYQITNNGLSQSAGNLNLISYDSTSNNHPNPSKVRIENTLYTTNNSAFIELRADSKEGSRYIYMESVSNNTSLKIDADFELISRYFILNNTSAIEIISNDETLVNESSNSIVTEYAIQRYVSNIQQEILDDLNSHITSAGTSHTYIDQSVVKNSSPTFNRVYFDLIKFPLAGTNNYIDTFNNSLFLKTGSPSLYIGGTSNTLFINSQEPTDGSPSKYVFNNGSSLTYASLEGNDLISHNRIQISNNWITPNINDDLGIYVRSDGYVKLSSVGVGGNTIPRISMFDISGYFQAEIQKSAFNKDFGINVDNVVEIGLALDNSLITGTDGQGKLITLSARDALSRLDLDISTVTHHKHDTLYVSKLNNDNKEGYLNLKDSLSYDDESSILRVLQPAGAHLTVATFYGFYAIILPVLWSGTTIKMEVSLTNNLTGDLNLIIRGSTSSNWHRPHVSIVTGAEDIAKTVCPFVRFGHNGTNAVILIGEESSYWTTSNLMVTNLIVTNGDIDVDTWNSGWSVTRSDQLSDFTINHTESVELYATNSDTVDGFHAYDYNDYTASSIPTRDSNGNLLAPKFGFSETISSKANHLVVNDGSNYTAWQEVSTFITNEDLITSADVASNYATETNGNLKVNLIEGWYSIAIGGNLNRSMATFTIVSLVNETGVYFGNSVITFTVTVVFNKVSISITSNVPELDNLIPEVRVLSDSNNVFTPSIIQVYFNDPTNGSFDDTQHKVTMAHSDGWELLDWTNDIPTNDYISSYVDLIDKGDSLITTTDLYAGKPKGFPDSATGGVGRVFHTENMEEHLGYMICAGTINGFGSRLAWWGKNRVDDGGGVYPFESSEYLNEFTIQHDFGSDDYVFVATGETYIEVIFRVTSKTNNQIQIRQSNDSGTAETETFSFALFALNN